MTFTTNNFDTGHGMIADALAAAAGGYGVNIAKAAASITQPSDMGLSLADLERIAPMPAPIYIGIAGPKRSGKDTLARALHVELGLPVDSFAAPLRKFVADLAGMGSLDLLELHKETPIPWLDGTTARQMMQTVGTEWGRHLIHPELWVRSLFARMPAGGIIPDVRFPNEAEAIHARGGVVIRITRPGYGQNDAHASEKPLPDHLVDFEVTNSGTPPELAEKALARLHGSGVI